MKKKIILDTDMGSDYDDAGAMAVLNNLSNEGLAEILAVTHCSSDLMGAIALKAINEWYGNVSVPVGKYEKRVFLENDFCQRFTHPIAKKYLEEHDVPRIYNATKLLRKTIAENKDITICVIGMLNNIAELLRSEPDDISGLSGIELVKNNVKDMFVMAGDFTDSGHREYNVVTDIESSQFVAEFFPKEIVYCGFEIGKDVFTGINLKKANDSHPVKAAYYYGALMEETYQRNSWDPITVYCAIVQSNRLYNKKTNKKISFDDNGETIVEDNGKDSYLVRKASLDEIRDEIDTYIV